MLKVTNLSFERDDKLILKNLNFELNAGQVLHIQGANGSGKTTLLQLLAGLLEPASGQIINSFSKKNYIGHMLAIKSRFTVLEHLNFYRSLYSEYSAWNNETILDYLQLKTTQHFYSDNLSAGQKQRLALSRLFIAAADLWLLDEPLTALDQLGQELLKEALLKHIANQGSVILTSHQLFELNNVEKLVIKL